LGATGLVEIHYGKLGVVIEEADDLLHGKGIDKSIAFVSDVTATGLLPVAARLRD
jgi:hypothetical protein